MSAESLLENPALFSAADSAGGEGEGEQPAFMPPPAQLAAEYCEFALRYGAPMSQMRGHVFKILHREVARHTHIRSAMTRNGITCLEIQAEVRKLAALEAEDPIAPLTPAVVEAPRDDGLVQFVSRAGAKSKLSTCHDPRWRPCFPFQNRVSVCGCFFGVRHRFHRAGSDVHVSSQVAPHMAGGSRRLRQAR